MRVERTLVGLMMATVVAAQGCGKLAYNLPPASRLMEPGPGVGGPGPGVIPPAGSMYGMYGGAVGRFGDGMGSYMGGGGYCAAAPNGAMGPMGPGAIPAPTPTGVMPAGYNGTMTDGGESAGQCTCDASCPCGDGACQCGCAEGGACNCGIEGPMRDPNVQQAGLHHLFGHNDCVRPGSMEASADGGGMGMATSQVAFLGSDGVQVSWDVSGNGMFDSVPLVIPGRQDFYQGAIYRLKLTNLPGRAGVTLYPTLEIAPVTPRTDAYLAHSPIPVQFTEEDFDQVVSGNFVTKVIYLPDPEFQELALAGVETLVSTRLDPGVDPIAEADRRGSILAIVRMGNKDIELNNGVQSVDGNVVPAAHNVSAFDHSGANRAMNREAANATGGPAENVMPAQYAGSYGGEACYGDGNCDGGEGCYDDGGYGGGGCYDDGSYGGGMYGGGGMGSMPVGMPTSGFAPPAVPPNMIAGAPQWGMPITGTPIGLPGPPHVPLGVPAGLQKHVMKNRTRVLLPPPVSKLEMSVKQRPGLNYPRPVNHVCVDETQREPFRILPTWVTNMFHHGSGNAMGGGAYGGASGGPCPQ